MDSTPGQLAKTLGRRVRLLRDAVRESLDSGNDALGSTLGLWRDHLLPDLTEKAFVDNYAQMAMAGLLLARGLQPETTAETFGLPVAQQALRNRGYKALAELLHHIDTAAGSGEEAGVCLSALSDAAAALDPSRPSDDGWWADFYEAFLNVYDRQLKNDMGVFLHTQGDSGLPDRGHRLGAAEPSGHASGVRHRGCGHARPSVWYRYLPHPAR